MLGQLFLAQKSEGKAIQEFENLLRVEPKAIQAHAILASIYERQNDVEKAKVHYQEALKIDPNFGVAANNLAWILCENGGNMDQALSLAQIARQKLPEIPNVADTLGWIYYKKKVYSMAISQLKECIEKSPDNPSYHYHLGMAYFMNGEKDKAKEMLSKAITIKPDFAGAEEAKKTLAEI